MHLEEFNFSQAKGLVIARFLFGWAIGKMVCLELPEVKQN